jgi:heptosyltransferase-2
MANKPQHVLVLALSGIGNILMQLPTIQAIKRQHPNWKITVWVAPTRGTRQLAENVEEIDEVIEHPLPRITSNFWPLLKRLRQQKYTAAIMLSPGQRIKGALMMYAAGIPKRIAHKYPLMGHDSKIFLTHTIPENSNLHDIEQNLKLLPFLEVRKPSGNITYTLNTNSFRSGAGRILQKNNLISAKNLMGIHAGSAPAFQWKRWPAEYFIELSKKLIAKHNAHILIFGGQEEKNLKKRILTALAPHATIVTTDLLASAALLSRCKLVVSNDSGIMHVAAASGATTIGLFGPTSEKNTGPRGAKSYSLRAPGTTPVYITEKKHALDSSPHISLQKLTPQQVFTFVEEKMNVR